MTSWPYALTLLLTSDVIAAGACAEGVRQWMDKHAPDATAVSVEDALAACKTDDERAWISRAARLDGDGYGYGYGYGDGYGDGDGR